MRLIIHVYLRRRSRGGEMGEFSPPPPFFSEPPSFFFFFLIPQMVIGSITLFQKFTPPPPPHFKILDPPLYLQCITKPLICNHP